MIMNRRQFAGGACVAALFPARAFASIPLDVALMNARVWTGSSGGRSDAVGIAAGRIAALGKEAVRARMTRNTQVIDLEGAFVMPGIIDPHTHFMQGAAMLTQPSLRDAATPEEFVRRIAAAACQRPGKWIQGGHWDEQLWGGELPHREWIDAATPDTPVAVARLDLHMYLCNSKALELAGIDKDTPDPAGGVIMRDERGEATGIIKDNAKALVERAIPERGETEVEETLRAGICYALSKGVTQAHVTALDWKEHDALLRLRAKGETGMRFYSFTPLSDWERLAVMVVEQGRGDDWVRWGGLKGLVDGSLGSRTALFYDSYTDAPGAHGVRVASLAELREWIQGADAAGLQVTTHAIGDQANDELLDIYSGVMTSNGQRDRRFRIEHAQHLKPDSISRFAELNVIASVQPYHAVDDGRWAVKRIGEERLNGTYAFHSLFETGAKVAFGSDWPVAPIDPLTGVAAAIARQTIDGANPQGWLPAEKVTNKQALTAYTYGGAYAGFQEDRLGLVAPGYLADLAVFDTDLAAAGPGEVLKANVLHTFVQGREV